MTELNDTIAAIATPLGTGGVGIVRVSGQKSEQIVESLFSAANNTPAKDMQTHRLYLGDLRDLSGRLLDRALVVLMRAPHSYTAEDVAEFQLHGGTRVLSAVLDAALSAGARLATPGEFTLRAYLNGRLDLTQAEAVADLIEAKSPRGMETAAEQVRGTLAGRIFYWEDQLTSLLSVITVGVDFPDDVDAPASPEIACELRSLLAAMDADLLQSAAGQICREGIRTALVGAVNVGKSSLLNRLLCTERAIVTELPGTTRDLIEESIVINGIALVLTDTAGLRTDAADVVEKQGIERSRRALDDAQLVLIVLDAAVGLNSESRELLALTANKPRLIVINKSDLQDDRALRRALENELPPENVITVSALTGDGIDHLKQAICRISGMTDAESGSPLITNARHVQALRRAREALAQACDTCEKGFSPDLAGVDIENALSALGEISGKTVSEQVLSDIFSRFCLGK